MTAPDVSQRTSTASLPERTLPVPPVAPETPRASVAGGDRRRDRAACARRPPHPPRRGSTSPCLPAVPGSREVECSGRSTATTSRWRSGTEDDPCLEGHGEPQEPQTIDASGPNVAYYDCEQGAIAVRNVSTGTTVHVPRALARGAHANSDPLNDAVFLVPTRCLVDSPSSFAFCCTAPRGASGRRPRVNGTTRHSAR